MVTLINNETNTPIGAITEAELAFLIDQLEEESSQDRDYYIAGVTVDIMASRGGDPALIALLRSAIGSADGVELRWESA